FPATNQSVCPRFVLHKDKRVPAVREGFYLRPMLRGRNLAGRQCCKASSQSAEYFFGLSLEPAGLCIKITEYGFVADVACSGECCLPELFRQLVEPCWKIELGNINIRRNDRQKI